ncbi:MAG: CHAT domain-containing protein [Bacteroidia bacterium]
MPHYLICAFLICLANLAWTQSTDSLTAKAHTVSMNELYRKGKYVDALPYADSAIQAWTALDNWPKVGSCLKIQTYCYGLLGRNEKAGQSLRRLEKLCQEKLPKDHSIWGGLYNTKVAVSIWGGEFDKAVSWSDAQIGFWQNKGSLTAAGAFINRGIAYYYISAPWEAIEACQHGLHILDSLGKKAHLYAANAYLCMGRSFLSLRHFKESEQYFKQAIGLYKSLQGEDHPNILIATQNMCALYSEKQDYSRAILLGKENLKKTESRFGKMHYLAGVDHFNIGRALFDKNELKEGEYFLRQSLAVREHSLPANHPDIAITRLFIGRLLRKKQDYTASKAIFKTALAEVDDNRESSVNYDLLMSLGMVYYDEGDFQKALAHYDTCIQAFQDSEGWRTVAHKKAVIKVLFEKANILINWEVRDKEERYKVAAATLKKGRDLLDSMRYLTRAEEASSHAALAETIYTLGSECCFELYTITHEDEWLEESFSFAEKRRASLLLQSLRSQQAHSFAYIPDALPKAEREAQTGLTYSEQQWEKERAKGPRADSLKLVKWEQKRLEYRFVIDSLQSLIRLQYPAYYRLKYNEQTASLNDVQSALNDTKSLFLEYSWTQDEDLILYMVSNSVKTAIRIKNDGKLTDRLDAFLTFLKDGIEAENRGYTAEARTAFGEQAYACYQDLLAPIFDKISSGTIDRLIIVPHGQLGYVPFEVLLSEQPAAGAQFSDMEYLTLSHTIRYAYSATLFCTRSQTQNEPQKFLAGFAPDYGESVESNTAYPTLALRDIAPLTQNQPEVLKVSGMMTGDSHCGAAATEDAFKQHAADYRILHLAMHAFVNDSVPLYSSLIFAKDTNSTTSEDGYLHTYEIYNLPLQAELVVLSACQTGAGKQRQGEGIMSLAHAFRYAGCPNIVTSLWQADDQSTARLMELFYTHLKIGTDKDKALQLAKRDFINEGVQTHPFYWAGFVLLGDEKPVSSNHFFSIKKGLIAVLLGVILILFYLFLKKSNRTR